MKNVYILCEGQTEEAFIKQILYPYFLQLQIVVYPIIVATRRDSDKKYKGGVSSYGKIRNELLHLCGKHPHETITTMFDYYGLPDDTPGIHNSNKSRTEKIAIIEDAVNQDINKPNCYFNLVVHEFESLLFVKPTVFNAITDDQGVAIIQKIKNDFSSPEDINNSPTTAPSKRIYSVVPHYNKVQHGIRLLKHIELEDIIVSCPHFADWIQKIKN